MITIVGNGAIGNVLAARCEILKQEYQLLVRSDISKPIQVTGLIGCEQIIPKSIGAEQKIDSGILILPLKAYQIISCLEQIKARVAKQVTIVLMHNGMVSHQQVSQLMPDHNIVAATTSYGAYKTDTAHLNITGVGHTHAGWLNPQTTSQQHRALLESLLPPCTWHTNIVQPLWQKLAINAVINPLTAMHNIRNGELCEPDYKNQIQQLNDETAKIMAALEMPVTTATLNKRCLQVALATAHNYSSMHQDIVNQRKSEIDFINGYIVGEGKRLGVAVTAHQQIWQQLKKMEASPPSSFPAA